MIDKQWVVYIIQAENGSLYTGVTNDLNSRFEKHASGKGAKFFHLSPPKEIVYVEKLKGKISAMKREREIKRLSRAEKLVLCEMEDKI